MAAESLKTPLAVNRERTAEQLIWALLFVRMAYGVGAMPMFTGQIWRTAMYFGYIFFTYLIIALLIYRERTRLSEYHIGKLAVILFLAGQPYILLVKWLHIANIEGFASLMLLPITVGLLIALLRAKNYRFQNPPRLLRSLLLGALVGVAVGVISGLLVALQPERASETRTLLQFMLLPTYQLANAAAFEEPLFRGFLWGLLEKKGWRGVWIWLFQAVLFFLGHIYYLGVSPYSLWLTLAVGLIFGLVAWRTRDIAPSMVAHSLTNGIAQIVAGT
jgi:membrane protease YdiL (CAAX protease family)